MENNTIQKNIPIEWKVAKIKDAPIEIADGNYSAKYPKQDEFMENGIPFVRVNNLQNQTLIKKDLKYISKEKHKELKKGHLEINDVLITTRGQLGIIALVPEEFDDANINAQLVLLRADNKILLPKFLMYFLLSSEFQSQVFLGGSGSALKQLPVRVLENTYIILPPLKEQQKIAEILETVDEDIAKTQEVIEATEKLKRGLMQSILSFRNQEDVKSLALGYIGKVSMCKRIFKKETSDTGDIPFYKIGTFGKEPDSFISQELFDSYRNKFSFPKIGDVLLSASGTIGRKVKYDGRPAYFQDSNIIWLEHDESKILNNFLFYLYDTIKWQTEGSTIKRLYNDILLKKVVPVPSIDQQKRTVEILSAIDEKISVNRKLKAKLTFLKKGLMQDLLSGRKRVIIN